MKLLSCDTVQFKDCWYWLPWMGVYTYSKWPVLQNQCDGLKL